MRTAIAILVLTLCTTAHAQRMGGSVHTAPSVIVYKTVKNFDKYVPVILSEDKSSIVSYPDPKDIYTSNRLAYPTKLIHGYRLDNRGINIHSAFLDITYEEYAKMTSVDLSYLMKHIKSKDPFLFFYRCNARTSYHNITKELNAQIRSGKLGECECLYKK